MVGGGGKSSLLFAIEQQWPGSLLLTTTTRIFAAQIKKARAWLSLDQLAEDEAALTAVLQKHRSCLIVGQVEAEKAIGVPPEYPAQWLKRPDVDLILIEADGSRRLPVKAPAPHEPVIPHASTQVVIMVGIDALSQPIAQIAHRPERVAALTGLAQTDFLTPETLAQLIVHPEGGLKDVAAGMQTAVCLNKVETAVQLQQASQIAHFLQQANKIDRVISTSLLWYNDQNIGTIVYKS